MGAQSVEVRAVLAGPQHEPADHRPDPIRPVARIPDRRSPEPFPLLDTVRPPCRTPPSILPGRRISLDGR